MSNPYYQGVSNEARVMRAFHNKIKQNMINSVRFNNYPKGYKISFLDLACGRGGDIVKLDKGVELYTGIDIDEKALEEAQTRYNEAIYRVGEAQFYKYDLTLPTSPSSVTYDIINIQFAIHYMAMNKEAFDNVLNTIVNHSHPGTYVLMTCMDGDKVSRLLPINLIDENNNTKFSVVKDSGNTVMVYNSLVNDKARPEGLVYHMDLYSGMMARGFEMIKSCMFEDMLTEYYITKDTRNDMKRLWNTDWTGFMSSLNRLYIFRRF